MSLATKYRPKTFEECVSQEYIIKILEKQVETKAFGNVYLLSGPSGCVDKDTEFFNGVEWKKISEYTSEDQLLIFDPKDRSARLEKPLNYIKLPEISFNKFKSKYGIDMLLCDEHNVVYETSKGNIATKSCKEVIETHNKSSYGFYGKFLTSFSYNGKGIELSDNDIKIMCAVICDGSFAHKSKYCCINLKKPRKINMLRQLLTESNLKFKESCQKSGYTRFYFYAPRREKEFSPYRYNCSQHQLQVICDNILFWDGCIQNNRKSFSQKSKKTIDFIQFAFSSCGFRARVTKETRYNRDKYINGKHYHYDKECYYHLQISNTTKIRLSNNQNKVKIEKVPSLDGYKYCFTCSTHMWIMRRNGQIIITGNCGKTTLARVLANRINNNLGTPIEIDAASNNGVDNIREIVNSAQERAMIGKYKIIILDEVHMLTTASWNAFLKCIEEPPKYTIFIFCTTDPQKIPATIQNRMMRFNLTKIPLEDIKKRLVYICEQEHFNYTNDSIDYIAKVSNGGLRDAIANLEKCASLSTDLTLDIVLKSLGNFSYDTFMELITSLIDGNAASIITTINDIYDNGNDLKIFIDQFIDFILDMFNYCIFKDFNIIKIPSTFKDKVEYNTQIENNTTYFSKILDELLNLKNSLRYDTTIKNTVLITLLRLSRGIVC